MILKVKNIHAGQVVIDMTTQFSCFLSQGHIVDLGAWMADLAEVLANTSIVDQLSTGWLIPIEYDATKTTPYFSTYP